VGVTIGESSPPADSPVYTFLGVDFDHRRHAVRPSAKTRDKLIKAVESILDPGALAGDILVAFGVAFFASSVLTSTLPRQGDDLHARNFYMVVKYMRRLGSRIAHKGRDTLAQPADLWPCIRPLFAQWCSSLATGEAIMDAPPAPSGDTVATVFTDASTTGWGVVAFFADGRIRSTGGHWTTNQQRLHINVKELIAARIGVQYVHRCDAGVLSAFLHIDNTSAISWIKRGRSPAFVANEVCRGLAASPISILSVSYVRSSDNVADSWSRITPLKSAGAA
jgi:hypothetical protein